MGTLVETIDLVTNFYTYEGVVKALNGVSLVVEDGATFGLVGESGCGKSVTVRSVMRIVQEPGRIEAGKIIPRRNGSTGGYRSAAAVRDLYGEIAWGSDLHDLPRT